MTYELRSLLAQIHLNQLGFYTGKLDGMWGPLSMAAAEAWDDRELVVAIPHTTPTPYDLAQDHLGTKEIPGSRHNNKIVGWLRRLAAWINEDETPWCSAFVDAMAAEAGYERSGKLNARSWLAVGQDIPLEKARPGDVAILWRGNRAGWEGHVGFYVSQTAGGLSMLGGNQGNAVSIATYPKTRLLGIRRLRPLSALHGNTSKQV